MAPVKALLSPVPAADRFVRALDAVVAPVPPYATATAVACHVPVPIVPTLVRLEPVTPLPRVVPDRTDVPAM